MEKDNLLVLRKICEAATPDENEWNTSEPASSTPSEQDERDAEGFADRNYKNREQFATIASALCGGFLAGRAGMVPASESLSWSLHKEICDGAIAEAEKAATMKERERCAGIVACVEFTAEGLNEATRNILNPPQETTAFNNMPKELPNEEAK